MAILKKPNLEKDEKEEKVYEEGKSELWEELSKKMNENVSELDQTFYTNKGGRIALVDAVKVIDYM